MAGLSTPFNVDLDEGEIGTNKHGRIHQVVGVYGDRLTQVRLYTRASAGLVVPVVQRLERCAANIMIVGSNQAAHGVCWKCFPGVLLLDHMPQL